MTEPSLETYLEWRKQQASNPHAHTRGMPIITSEHLADTEEREEPRTWRERLFSWPWRPWEKTKTVYMQVPKQKVYVVDGKIICHPAIAAKIREAMRVQ